MDDDPDSPDGPVPTELQRTATAAFWTVAAGYLAYVTTLRVVRPELAWAEVVGRYVLAVPMAAVAVAAVLLAATLFVDRVPGVADRDDGRSRRPNGSGGSTGRERV